jgi:hypothetical protein
VDEREVMSNVYHVKLRGAANPAFKKALCGDVWGAYLTLESSAEYKAELEKVREFPLCPKCKDEMNKQKGRATSTANSK